MNTKPVDDWTPRDFLQREADAARQHAKRQRETAAALMRNAQEELDRADKAEAFADQCADAIRSIDADTCSACPPGHCPH